MRLEFDFIDQLGATPNTAEMGRLRALRHYAKACALRADWGYLDGAQVQDYLQRALRRAEADDRTVSFHNP
jgi:hypothetical protein